MLKSVLLYAFAFACVGGIVRAVIAQEKPRAPTPFSLAVDPGHSGITMAQNNPDEFHVIVTNISKEPQAVRRRDNSWD